jgi:hypothetical protein
MKYELNERELATVLAALRCWQKELARTGIPEEADDILGERDPLTLDEIDDLWERLNFSGGECPKCGYAGPLPHAPDSTACKKLSFRKKGGKP